MINKELIEKLAKLSGEEKEDLSDELISYVTKNDIKMSQEEQAKMFQFVKGHYNSQLLSSALDVVNRVDPVMINKISEKYAKLELKPELKPKFELKTEESKIVNMSGQNLFDQVNKLSKEITGDLIDDLLSILSNDELKKLNLSQRERLDILQLIKGHYSPSALFNALQAVTRAFDELKTKPTPVITRDISRELLFGVELVPAMGLDKLVDFARKFEIGGVDNIWITDHYTNMDPYVTLTLIAKATSAAFLGIGVTNPYMRHLASTASAIASLDQVSNNRMKLGIGAGDKSTLASLNIETKNALTLIDETVKAIKLLWKEENVNYSGEIVKLQNARLSFRPERNIPIYIGAQGPQMLKLAGEIGDGILVNASHELDFKYARERIIEGVEKANKKINDVDLTAYTCFSVSDDPNQAKKATVPVVAFIAAATPEKVLERHGLNIMKASQMREYLAKGDMPKAFQLVDDSFLESFSVSGNVQQIINKIENLKSAGVNQFVFGSPLGPKKGEAISIITEKLLPSYLHIEK